MKAIMRKINIISRCCMQYRTDKVSNTELSACHHSYIFAISSSPGISQDELAKNICVNKSNITRNLAHLEAKGYVDRHPGETDKRLINVYPTEKMLKILPRVKDAARNWNKYLTDGIDDKEMEIFQSVLETLAQRAKDYLEKGGAKEK